MIVRPRFLTGNGGPGNDGDRDTVTRVLGIETSCDETAAAIVSLEGGRSEVLSSVVLSQIAEHEAFGGVVPEIAARAHVEALDGVVAAAFADAKLGLAGIDAIAVTAGPGLIGGLIVGVMTAKALAAASGKRLVAINHLEGHALTARLTDSLDFPYLLLLVSGGHTQIVLVRGVGDYERWATTIDDALGEAFDKTAKLLGLPYPGGPSVEKAAARGDAVRFDLPRPLKGEARLDFSFSGLKTAVRQAAKVLEPLTDADVDDICASFQRAVSETLADRVGRSLERFHREFPGIAGPALVVAGGVAANSEIRSMLTNLCRQRGFRFVAPPLELCTDNAVMIAWAGLERLRAGKADENAFDMAPRSRWPLDEDAAPALGGGRRGAKA
jgi:N6-L-threonylcarbamoyladenine synthase